MEKEFKGTDIKIMRKNDDLLQKLSGMDRKDLKIGAKLFLNNENSDAINQALHNSKYLKC